MNNLKLKSLGKILVKARKSMNLTRKDISNKLCLKLDIISNIEKDIFPSNIPLVFFRGYIFSYARLVNISNKKVLLLIKNYKINNILGNKNSEKKYFNNKINFFLFVKIFFFIKIFLIFSIVFIYYINIKNKIII